MVKFLILWLKGGLQHLVVSVDVADRENRVSQIEQHEVWNISSRISGKGACGSSKGH